MSYKYIAITKQWRDKVNGNSYFSSVVEDSSGNIVLKMPFQYGYGTQSEYEIRDKLFSFPIKAPHGKIKFIKIDRCTKKEVKLHVEEL
tara:strand:+ start:606 stop:869 length:264 start_codon:yes stop_codon:yes gene_type:complete